MSHYVVDQTFEKTSFFDHVVNSMKYKYEDNEYGQTIELYGNKVCCNPKMNPRTCKNMQYSQFGTPYTHVNITMIYNFSPLCVPAELGGCLVVPDPLHEAKKNRIIQLYSIVYRHIFLAIAFRNNFKELNA